MKKSLFLTCFVMLCTLVFGQNHWTVNDALYENSMSLLANVKIGNEVVANAEIAAFYDDEVRGVGKTDANGKVFLTIHGGDREQITFKLYDGVKEYASNYTVDFVTNGFNTSPVSVDFYEIYWNYEPNYDLHASMTIVGDIHIDGVAQTSDNFELAVFYNDSLRGVARPNNGIVYLYISGYGKESKPFEFRLYDGTRELVADTSDINVTFITNNILGSIDAPLCLNFITTPYVAQVGKVKYQSFANAFNAALENNATITLLENFAIDSETYTVADGKNVTLDMAGKTITVTDNKTANYELFYIYGGMTVEGEGTIELTSANNRGWNAMSAIFHNRGGVLTIENGTYKNLGGTDMAWVVDNSGNWYGDATTNINGGELTSTYTAIRNRMEQNTHGASGKAILNVDGGTIEGTTSAIWAQAASESTTAPATGEINITGGKVGLINTARSAGAVSMTTVAGGTVAAFKGEAGELKVQGGTITGTVTIMNAAGKEVPYVITSEGLYVEAVAQIGTTNYATLQEAVNVGGTVKVLQNIVLEEPVTVAKEVVVVLNLDGKTINVAYAEGSTTNHIYAFENKGILTIEGNGTINARGIFNHGAMTLTNGTINAIDGNGGYAVRNYEGATFTMTDGTIATTLEDDHKVNNGGYDATTVRVDEGATFVMNGGTINNICDYTFAIDNYGTTTVNAGTIKSVHSTVSTYGTMTIKDGTFTCNGIEGVTAHALVAWDGSATTIKGGTFDGKDNYNGFNIDAVKGATVYIEGGKFLQVHSGSLYGEGTILASGGTFFDEVAEKHCAPSYICVENTDGTYSVVRGLRGAGTEKDPFVIKTIEDLKFFRDEVNEVADSKYNAPSVYVALGAEIDMASENWVGIGSATADHGFMGNFDGKNFKIKNLTITNPTLDSDGYAYAGLFAVTEGTDKDNQNTIKNLTIENVTINTTGHIVSAAIAYPYYTIVDNVKVCGNIEIKGGDYTAGVLAYTRRCVNASNLSIVGNTNSSIKGNQVVGGVISDIQMNGGLTAVYNNFSAEGLTITGTKSVGGISGIICKQTLDGASVNNVTLTSSDVRVGIVSGSWGDVSTISNVTFADVTGTTAIIGATYKDGAAVEARIDDTYYATFAAALEAADEDDIVTLLVPYTVEAGETLTINKNVTYSSDVLGETMITNKGTLTINGEVSYTYTGAADATYSKGNYTINNSGELVVGNGAVVKVSSGRDGKFSHALYAINNSNTLTINGTVQNDNNIAVRQLSSSNDVNLTINEGSTVKGTRALWIQLPNNNTALAPVVNVNIKGGSIIGNGPESDGSKLAIYSYSYGNDMANVKINIEGGEFTGDVALTGGANKTNIETVNISGGTFNGDVYSYGEDEKAIAAITIIGGTFATNDAEKYAEDNGYIFVPNAQGTYTVTQGQYVAKIGEVRYASFASAIAAVKNGETIELIKDCAEEVTIKQVVNKNFTINGNGKTYTGTINVNGNNRGAGLTGAGLTITKVNFKNEVNTPISITTTEYACNITVDGCTFTGKEGVTTYGIKLSHALNITVNNVEATDVFDLVYSSKVVTGFTAENVKATNVEYGFFMSYGKNLSFKNVEVNATMSGVGLNNYNASQATFENCKFTAKWPVYFMAPNSTNKYSLVFNGTENAFTSNVEGEEWLYVEKTSAVIKATYNDEELVAVSSMPAKIGKVHYNSLQHAINAVENDGTVTLAANIVYNDNDILTAESENYKVMNYVTGKNITLDMNSKTIDVTYTGGNYLMAVVLVADGAGLTINGNGTINAVGQNADGTAAKNIAYMIWKRGETGYLNIVNGTFHLNTAADSIIYTNGDEIVTVNGGTFILDAVASQTNGFPVIFSTTGNNEKQIVVNAGTFNYDINHQIRPFEVYVSEDKALKKSQIDGRDMWTIVPAEAYVTELLGEWVNASGDREHKVGYATLEEAVAAVNNLGNDVTLLKDVTIDELIKIEKEATLDLNGNKVTSTAKKAFEVYADATITNGTIEAANRAVDTRTAVKLTLTDVTLVADKYYSAYGNPQPLTIGGYDHGTVVTLNNVDINAGTAGYGIITFVKTTLTADEKTNVYGYAALYVQDGSEGSEFVFNGSTLTGDLTGNDVEGNSFSTIAIQEDGVNVTMNGGKLISVGDNHTALSIGNVNVPVHENNNVTIDAEITGNILSTVCADENVIRVKAEYADNLNTAGYATSEPEEDGLVTVLGQAVAQVEDALFATLQDAVNAADGKTVEVLANIAQSGTTVVTGTVTIDLNGFTVAYTSANPGEDMITVKGGTLVINDSESDGKITYVNTDATAGNVTVSTISVEPNSTLIVNGGTIENKTVKADGSRIYSYAIDILTNGGLGDVNVTINGGTVYSDYMAIRQFNNGTACKNTLVVTDGYIYGAKRAIQIHMDNNAAYTTISGGKVEGGNYSLCFLTTSENILVKGGEFIGDVWYSGTEGFIKGGTFDRNVTKYCVVNYSAVSQDNGTWVVEQTAGTLTRDLENGWNWFSSYVDIEGSYGFGLLKEALGTSAEQIKEGKTGGQGVFAQYSAISNSWGGNLTATSSKKMYQIKTTAEVQVNIYGDFFGIENYRPILQKGWNYISYPHTETLEVALALQGFNPVDGDIIKTLGSSMTYFEGAGWIVGNLPNMEPGVGYMYRSNAGNKQVSYTTEATRSAAKAYVSEAPEYWTIGTAQYPNNMTMIATLDVEGGDYEVAAFVDGELRGSVRPVYVEELDQYIMVMTILGEEVADITFKYYDFNTEEEYELNNVVVYSDNAVVGSVEEPYALTRGTTGIDEATLSDINIYPNPTTTDREINLQATCDKVEVFNTLGIKVAEYQNVDSIDALETAGTYVIRVTLNGDVKHCRLVVR